MGRSEESGGCKELPNLMGYLGFLGGSKKWYTRVVDGGGGREGEMNQYGVGRGRRGGSFRECTDRASRFGLKGRKRKGEFRGLARIPGGS